MNHKWQKVTPHSPCPVCYSTSLCEVLANVICVCRRRSKGGYKVLKGKPGWLFDLDVWLAIRDIPQPGPVPF